MFRLFMLLVCIFGAVQGAIAQPEFQPKSHGFYIPLDGHIA